MVRRSRPQRSEAVRVGLFVLGCVLMVIAPVIGILPGPGFIIVFPIGLALALQNSRWAKKRYARFKRRHPRYGEWADRGLRRASGIRRLRRRRERAASGD